MTIYCTASGGKEEKTDVKGSYTERREHTLFKIQDYFIISLKKLKRG